MKLHHAVDAIEDFARELSRRGDRTGGFRLRARRIDRLQPLGKEWLS
jgi:hypothetical protein